jgi:hypothetical protein
VNRYTVVLAVALIVVLSVFNRTQTLRALAGERSIRVAVVYTPDTSTESQQIRAAYTETLLENGIPFDWLASTDLSLFDGEQLASSYSAIVFPDGINRRVSEDAVAELTSFAALGGSVATIGDAGSRTLAGTYRPGSLFTEISGVDSLLVHHVARESVRQRLRCTSPGAASIRALADSGGQNRRWAIYRATATARSTIRTRESVDRRRSRPRRRL